MTALTNVLCNLQGIDSITDQPELHKFTLMTGKTSWNTKGKIQLAEAAIHLNLPQNLSEIPLQQVIELRNKQGYKIKLNAFHTALDSYYYSNHDHKTAMNFINSLNQSIAELKKDITYLSAHVFALSIGMFLALSSANDLRGLIAPTLSCISVGSTIYNIKNSWTRAKPDRFAQKYLATLRTSFR